MRKGFKVSRILSIAVVGAVICFFVYLVFGGGTYRSDDVSLYRALSAEIEGESTLPILGKRSDIPCPYDLPQLGDLQPYSEYRFHYMAKRVSIFESHAYVLIVHYDKADYDEEKSLLEQKYTYCTGESEGFSNGLMSEWEYTLDEFVVRAVKGGEYPKEMLFIGTSDVRQEIAIIYFYDQDLDFVDVPLGKFLTEETGWAEVV